MRGVSMYLAGPVLGIASGPILARCLGPDGRGQFAAIMAPIAIAGAVASLGLPSAIVYFGSRWNSPWRVYIRASLLCVFPALLTYCAMAIYAQYVSVSQDIPLTALLMAWLAILLSAAVQLRRALWQSLSAWRLLDIERGLSALCRFVAVVAVALLVSGSAIAVAAAALLAFALSSSVLFIRRPAGARDCVRPVTADIAKYGVVASLGTIMTIAGSRLDQLLLPATSTASELGFYAVAVTVAEVPLVLGTLAARNALTLSSAGRSVSQIVAQLKVYLSSCLGLVILLALAAPLMVPIVFGSDFNSSI